MTDGQAELIAARLDDVVRLLAAQFARQFESQSEAAVALSDAGFGSGRIADLLGAKPDSVRKAIQRAKK